MLSLQQRQNYKPENKYCGANSIENYFKNTKNSFWKISKKLWWFLGALKSEDLVVVCTELRPSRARAAKKSRCN
jgi:hypothetical protein